MKFPDGFRWKIIKLRDKSVKKGAPCSNPNFKRDSLTSVLSIREVFIRVVFLYFILFAYLSVYDLLIALAGEQQQIEYK